ncbi:hypothetical protein C2E23DRAFT_823357 [Lenzites betulinus]|nr:hypothetical protein C2E23DRAFT_823357 [Lenzites betulinus]
MSDDYDSLPDPFEGIDFDQIPALCQQQPADNSSDYDAYFDDIDPRELDRIPALGPIAARDPAPSRPRTNPGEGPRDRPPPPDAAVDDASHVAVNASQISGADNDANAVPASSQALGSSVAAPSTQYTFDEIDDHFLQEVTIVELEAVNNHIPAAAVAHNIMATQNRRRSSTSEAGERRTQRSAFKRKRSDVSSASATPSSKRKRLSRVRSGREGSVDPHASARTVLTAMEQELTCPICFELLVAAYSTNPCGHSCCGGCLLQWVKTQIKTGGESLTQRLEPWKCPVCRCALDKQRPMIPNIGMDSAVRTHISAAADVGKADWQPSADRYQDFVKRKEQSATLAQQVAQLQDPPAPPSPPEWRDLLDDMDSDYDDSGSEA